MGRFIRLGLYLLHNSREDLRVLLGELREDLTIKLKALHLECVDEGAVALESVLADSRVQTKDPK